MSRGANGMVLLKLNMLCWQARDTKNVFQLVLSDNDIYRHVRNLCEFAHMLSRFVDNYNHWIV